MVNHQCPNVNKEHYIYNGEKKIMVKKLLLTLATVLLVTGCATQRTDKAIAYNKFEDGNYAQTIEWIRRAESREGLTSESQAELTYLEALSLEKMGEYDSSQKLFTYLVNHHAESKYAYLASSKIKKDIQ